MSSSIPPSSSESVTEWHSWMVKGHARSLDWVSCPLAARDCPLVGVLGGWADSRFVLPTFVRVRRSSPLLDGHGGIVTSPYHKLDDSRVDCFISNALSFL